VPPTTDDPDDRAIEPTTDRRVGDDWGLDDWDDEDGVIYVADEKGPLRRGSVVAALGLGMVLLLVVGAGLWVRGKLDPAGARIPVEVTIPPEATTAQIATLLEEQGVVSDATVFRYYVKWQDAGPFQAGTYDGLTTNQPMGEVVDRLSLGPLPPEFTELVVPEGLWLADIRQLILDTYPDMDAEELDQALFTVRSRYQPEGATLEGLLFPATYRVLDADRDNELKLVEQMVTTFDKTAEEIGLGDAAARLEGQAGDRTITPYEAIIIASLIEEEAKLPEDQPKIARVMYNRLERDMRLDIDATVIYALGAHTEELTRSDLQVDSPYNTRRYPGIPPGPIASPGRSALEAALNPAEGDWLYYVLADAEGRHFFTADQNEFDRAVQRARDAGLL
jgi:UPF0755 protein